MFAIACIAVGVLFILFVLGRGTGKTVAQTEMAARKVPVIAKNGVEKTIEGSSFVADKAVSASHTTALKGKAAVSTGIGVSKLVAQSTATTVRGALRSCRENYHNTKNAQLK